MIRSANHSSYPIERQDPSVEQLLETRAAHARGDVGDTELIAVEDEVASIVLAEQSRAFVGIVTDGMTRWSGPLAHVASHVNGLAPGAEVEWPGTPVHDRRPVCTGPIEHAGSFLVRDLEVAMGVAQTPVKVVLPGPVTFARLTEDRHYRDPSALAAAVAAVLAIEVAALAEAGCVHFQLDEPLLGAGREVDHALLTSTSARVFSAAGPTATTVLSTWDADLSRLDADGLARLPGTHIGLDLAHVAANEAVVSRLPGGKGVYLGLFDAGRSEVEDATDLAERLAALRSDLLARDVIVGPQHGLAALPRDDAFDKLLQARYLTEKLEREWDWV